MYDTRTYEQHDDATAMSSTEPTSATLPLLLSEDEERLQRVHQQATEEVA